MFAFLNAVKKTPLNLLAITTASIMVSGGRAFAHVSEMGLVLLMPTGLYIQAGVWVVGLTALALLVLRASWIETIFATRCITPRPQIPGVWLISCATALLMIVLIWAGFTGSRDPLVNPLPLMVWTVIWIGLLLAQGIVGDVWRVLNPWSGPVRLMSGQAHPFRLPEWLGVWPGCVGVMAFACFALADPAPDDPARLATFTGGYWLVILCACLLWGTEPILTRCEFLSMIARRFADLAVIGSRTEAGTGATHIRIGLPGWALVRSNVSLSTGIFALLILGIGSFDGVNETFWWLGQIGVNPLEFPGRSALIGITIVGLLGSCALLVVVFWATLWMGLRLAPAHDVTMSRAFGPLALSVLPIGFAYHFAHYLTTLLVSGQYAIAALSDPLGTGADWLGLGQFYVTTSFFNTTSGVEAIFQAQARAVIIGHMLSVLIAHAIATGLFRDARKAAISQIPLATFMVAYTFLGLWLLASPKGG